VLVMQADPGRLVHRMSLQQPRAARDDLWIHATTAALLQQPAVRRAFGLPSPAPRVGSADLREKTE
jgi:hypothetical protein